MREVLERSLLERSLDQAAVEETNRFHTVLAIAYIASLNADHAHHSVQNRCLEEGTGRETNGHDRTTRPDILRSLLEWLLRNSQKDDCVRPEAFGGCSLDLSNEVLRRFEVYICLESLAQCPLK